METSPQTAKTVLLRLWEFLCSLKVAIVLASAAALLIMGGSLVMHYNPRIFGGMEQEIMSEWLPGAWSQAPQLVFWVPLSGLCVILFAINTLCCLIDWLGKISTRWRKTGEYLIHTGFILLTIAYLWGNLAGFRSGPHSIFPGTEIKIPHMPEYTLRLESFTPQLNPQGRPLDMVNQVSLRQNGKTVRQAEVRINHPLIHDGLIILPTSFGQALQGFRFHLPEQGMINLAKGSRLTLANGQILRIRQLLPDARRSGRGQVQQVGDRLGNPAMQIVVQKTDNSTWQGWYFLREGLPTELSEAGILLRPIEPIFKTYSLLTINRDPGDKLALVGSLCLSIGVILAFFSFYRKRARGDRPDV